MLKVFASTVFGAVGLWMISGIGSDAYSRSVAKPQNEVMAALAEVDVIEGARRPGPSSCRGGDLRPCVKLERFADHMTWTVMRNAKASATMIANFTPTIDGRATQISTSVQHYGLAGDRSTAFDSRETAMRSFAVALDARLDKLLSPGLCQTKCTFR